ncbi:MAG: type 2 lanthipeptide synthetase LanM [Vicinamibacterales bacterium]
MTFRLPGECVLEGDLVRRHARSSIRMRDAAREEEIWFGRLTALCAAIRSEAAGSESRGFQTGGSRPDGPVSFDGLWRSVARSVVASWSRRPEARAVVEGAAFDGLRDDLERRLVTLTERALWAQLHAFEAAPGSRPQDIVGAFVEAQRASGLAPLLSQCPVLGRLIGHVVVSAEDAWTELLTRVAGDRAVLSTAFGVPPEAHLTHIEVGHGDPHEGGRTVAAVVFSSGHRLAYKPRPLELDAAFQQLIADLNDWSTCRPLRTVRTLVREGYGYAEWVPRGDEDDSTLPEAAEGSGRLLALLHVLGGEDAHRSNVVRCGRDVMLVDGEMLLQSTGPAEERDVRRTGMLPRPLRSSEGETVDVSALGAMFASVPAARRPSLIESVCDGFRLQGLALAACRDRLLAPGGSFEGLAACQQRVLLRATRVYAQLLFRATMPAALAEGEAFARALAPVARRYREDHADAARTSDDLEVELRALENLDIPVFRRAVAAGTGLADARHRLARFDRQAIEAQIVRVRSSLAATLPPTGPPPPQTR